MRNSIPMSRKTIRAATITCLFVVGIERTSRGRSDPQEKHPSVRARRCPSIQGIYFIPQISSVRNRTKTAGFSLSLRLRREVYLSTSHIDSVFASAFKDAGFEIVERGECSPGRWPEVKTSCAKRLESKNRSLIYIIARATANSSMSRVVS